MSIKIYAYDYSKYGYVRKRSVRSFVKLNIHSISSFHSFSNQLWLDRFNIGLKITDSFKINSKDEIGTARQCLSKVLRKKIPDYKIKIKVYVSKSV